MYVDNVDVVVLNIQTGDKQILEVGEDINYDNPLEFNIICCNKY